MPTEAHLIDILNKTSISETNASCINVIEPRSLYESINESKLRHLVDNGNIWGRFNIIKSFGDGHCLLYLIIESMRYQHNCTKINLNKLIECITVELLVNKQFYTDSTDYRSERNIEDALNMYIHSRIYETSFDDLVPIIIANALCVNIAIAALSSTHCRLIPYRGCVVAGYNNTVFIRKVEEHYDGMCANTNASSEDLACECNICRHDAVMPTSIPCETQRPDVGMIHVEMNAADQLNHYNHMGENACYFPAPSELGVSADAAKCTLDIPVVNCADGSDLDSNFNTSASTTNLSLPTKCVAVPTHAEKNSVTCCSWNIHGLTESKLRDDILGKFLKTHDIILLTETWTKETDDFFLDGYIFYNYPRKFKHHNAIRKSGGLGIFLRKSITDGIVIGKCSEEIVAWIMLKKQYFGLNRDIYIANAYIVPETSAYLCHDAFGILQCDIASRPPDSDVILCGDYNAHTNVALDYIIDELDGSNGDLDNLVPYDSKQSLEIIFDMHCKQQLQRHSVDRKPLNSHGSNLIDLCKSLGLLIVNGRLGEDKGAGGYTRIDTTGCSVVDYVIANPRLFSSIKSFAINGKMPESDHLAISFSIRCLSQINACNASTEMNLKEWQPQKKIRWQKSDLTSIKNALIDEAGHTFLHNFLDALAELRETNQVALAINEYISQAVTRVCRPCSPRVKYRANSAPQWFDSELRQLRSQAVRAGEKLINETDRATLVSKCKIYRANKQRKKRDYYNNIVRNLECAFTNDKCSIWDVLNKVSNDNCPVNEPCGPDFVSHFMKLDQPQWKDYFDDAYEKEAIAFLNKYDSGMSTFCGENIELDIINSNFTKEEIESCIDFLKNNKAPGVDGIPAEIIKHCKQHLSEPLSHAFNYIAEKRDFPEVWAEGLRSTIFKSGNRDVTDNYRGITVLPIIEKIFEVAVYRRLSFVNEAFGKIDENNGGFLQGRRTADNIFVLQCLVQRQLVMGNSLVVCFVDFSKAFDLVNRNILFYKMMKSGWHGKVIDALRSLYSKTSFRVKNRGWASFLIHSALGVNQGGIASGLLFRKYMADMGDYLESRFGVCMGHSIIMHLLWADDLVLISDTCAGLQKQLDGLQIFCSKNLTAVNEIKTKCMSFGKIETVSVTFNHKNK